ncbi:MULTISPECIES: PucR family transcriptional regulator [Streptomyces]|uniref:PucR family transcriptional regulator n=1 Tax=Streptomyces TaxID=1883 RepID=UPI00163CC468|nr:MULTISPECIES: helix-turn-helix domain-containing protein [Streptomyces]MBC2878411.1 helix-turn-helix domain-containing protein [Streptomyces sp. TYQ1024]UBI38750.1 helix-turn-helix domain-containing protein [Streptomyces mobaraensis]UKW31330.1 helix-turn-helix domain-containing protein [Streptomyces sp. TYQ1024]
MDRPAPSAEIVPVARALLERVSALGGLLARRVRAEVESYGDEHLLPDAPLYRSCVENLRLPLLCLAGRAGPADLSSARETGRERALQDVPLAGTLHAFRIGFELLWAELAAEARRAHDITSDTLLTLSSEVWRLAGAYSDAMAAAYRETAAELAAQREHERSALVEALLTGAITDRSTMWEAARALGLPGSGPFIVVAADVPAPGRSALPRIEATLRAGRVPSAWRLLPGQRIGVMSVLPPDVRSAALAILARSEARVGVSPPYDSLRDTPQALRYARLALAALPRAGAGVVHFDDDPLAMLVAAAPAEAGHIARTVFDEVLALPADERERLLDTLERWFAAGGSAAETGRRLYCHPNTVRYRLRRLEELTGRSLQDPRAVVDLGAALRALRVLPEEALGGGGS